MPSVDQLQALYADLLSDSREAKGRGDVETALRFAERAHQLMGAIHEDAPRLPVRLPRGKYSLKLGSMDDTHREAISKGRSKRNPMLRLAREKGYPTMDALCDALKAAAAKEKVELRVSPSFLSQIVSKTKPLPPDLGKRLRALIGWEP